MKTKVLIRDFLKSLEIKGYSPFTLRNHKTHLSFFAGWLKKKKIAPDFRSLALVNAYCAFLAEKGISKPAQNGYLISLRSFYRFLGNQGTQVLPLDKIELIKVPDRNIVFLTSSQVKKMLESASSKKLLGLRDRAILELLFASGLRVSELCSLDKSQINFRNGEFTIIGKGGRARLVFIADEAKTHLLKYLEARKDDYPPLFLNIKGKKSCHLNTRTVQRIVAFYARKAGLPMKVHPHLLRHAYACHLLSNGANLRLVQELLGHKNIATTQIYTHVTNAELREGYFKYHA